MQTRARIGTVKVLQEVDESEHESRLVAQQAVVTDHARTPSREEHRGVLMGQPGAVCHQEPYARWLDDGIGASGAATGDHQSVFYIPSNRIRGVSPADPNAPMPGQ